MPLLNEALPLPAVFVPGEYRIEEACAPYQKAACFALRSQVFCGEQQIFELDDRDEIDGRATLLIASSCLFGHVDEVVGTVRIHEPEPKLWWGSRLAVAKPYRRVGGLGAALIKLAVGTAKFQGAELFMAHVQAQNKGLFEALHWRVLDHKIIHDRPHYLMQADLGEYEAIDRTAIRLLPSLREHRDA
jgi:putative N-acetyltransferase (TIGR04045 family)